MGRVYICFGSLILLLFSVESSKEFNRITLTTEDLKFSSILIGIKSKLRCAGYCSTRADCFGLVYKDAGHECRLLGCFNPELDSPGDVRKEWVYAPAISHVLAQGKLTQMSSTIGYPNEGRRAVDGLEGTIAHSHLEANPWLRVDLEQAHCFWAVRIHNRGNEVYSEIWERTRNAIVTASNVEDHLFLRNNPESLCAYHAGILDRYFTTMTCVQPMRARFVQMLLNATTIINIYEFEVHGFF
ncbi:fucolectin-like [Watersipora subatra]|uniref:fucolectin-like n=1 Tax=Watersipora subatra TaxID=2589382 RepID=UPI00355C42A0